MSLIFFSGHDGEMKAREKRYYSRNTVRIYMHDRPYLPAAFREAMKLVIADKPLKQEALAIILHYMDGRPYLPQDFRQAMVKLVPQVDKKTRCEFDHHADFSDNE